MPPLGKKGSVFPARSQGVFGCVSIRGHGPRQMPSLADPNILTSENCREQHLKCDRVTPICGRCQNAGRECRRTGLRVRETKAPYAKNQKWVRTPRRIVFIHETNLANEGDGLSPDSGPEDYLEVDASGSPDAITDGPSRRSSLQSPIKSCSMTPVSPRFPRDILTPKRYSPHDESLKSPNSYPTLDQHQLRQQKGSSEDEGRNTVKEKSASPSDRFIRQPIYIDHTILPFTEAQRARLMRHYVQKLAIWLDLCDPEQSFQTVVPIRAGRCPILLNSIMALAGRHLAHVDKAFPAQAYLNYSHECLRQLTVWAGAGLLSEDVFAALIIMRVMAELEAKDNGGTLDNSFLVGLQLCVQHQTTMLRQKSLGAAAFWVGLRQEIYNAVATQTQVKMLQMDFLPDIIDREVSSADDYVWANRAVVHCAEVLNYCFGPNTEKRRERWEELSRWNRDWLVGTADTYVPIYREANKVPFPEIWYNQSCHVIGTQHHLLAELFLTYYHPDLPYLGPAAEHAKEKIKPKGQSLVREICGIGLGNSWTPPSMFTACMAIHVFGHLFTDRRDQEQMMDILRRTEHEHGRPTAKVQAEMVHYVWHWKPIPDYIIKQEDLNPETLIWANQQLR